MKTGKKYKVYHSRNEEELFTARSELWKEADQNYRLVAEVEASSLAEVYHLTNHIERDWRENAGVSPSWDEPVRSTSVGDVIVQGETAWLVTAYGFVEIKV